MTDRTYPYTAWILMPSFKPVQVELVKLYQSYSNEDYGDLTASGRCYSRRDIYLTREDAIETGYRLLLEQQVKLETRLANVRKKRQALVKAETDAAKVGAQ